ncbi:sulfite exporter TauE/SafE family protein [Bosea sp. (in: a-proteobacteria)]|uniref:sulfite exporter TauE/SafE family protein n=1 Tax=Bosea sp. (in: a-proteobacteria) TaxID=1871050 RepID=UPI00263621C6|nr:sulfite exporter TauE/SafE family protein [Bosea sp. (in: a-proteobacteria)]MCO5091482.1 sulfite exporter TauE/SafE family protein [Bosea sp. (in: a-proteobacteria)]
MSFDLAFFATMVPAVILSGLAKGGFAGLGLLAVPVMALVVSPVTAAAILLPLLIAQDVVSVWSYRREFDRRNLAILAPGASVGILAGYLLAAKVPDAAVGLVVGLISIGFALRRLTGDGKRPPAATRAAWGPGSLWGFITGFTSMVAHAGGPPFQIYVMPQKLPPAVFVGTGAIFFASMNLVKVVPYLALGQFNRQNLAASAALLPFAIAATFAGVWLVRRIPAERFYGLIYWLLLLVGAKLVWSGIHDLHLLG